MNDPRSNRPKSSIQDPSTARPATRWALLAAALCVTSLPAAAQSGFQERITCPDGKALDWFGYDVYADGQFCIAGSFRDDDAGADTGSAHVVHADGRGTCTYVQKLVLQGAAAGDRAGENVAMAEGHAAVSAPGRTLTRSDGSTIQGTVAIFEEQSGVWVQVAELDDPTRSQGDLFGQSVAIHRDYILVGAPRDDQFAPDAGAVYVFEKTSSGWTRTQKLSPDDAGQHDYFGHDLALAGKHAVATAYNDDDRGVNAGAAYVLDLGAGSWSVGQKLIASEGNHFDLFGTCAAMIDGTIVIGAPQNEDGDDDAAENEGAAFIYEWSGTASKWVETMVLRPGDPNEDHRFGIDVDIDDNVIVVGASHSDAGILNSGSAHIFRQRGRDWFEVERHVSATSQPYDYLGLSVAVGTSIFVGVPGANDVEAGAGGVDVVAVPSKQALWGQTFCHGEVVIEGFKNMGGPENSAGRSGRLCTAGSPSISRDDLVLRAVGLPTGTYGTLYMGAKRANYSIGDGNFCLSAGGAGFRFVNKFVTADGRLIQRHPVGRIENALPGAAAALAGTRMYAQMAYVDRGTRSWNTTNAIRIDFTN